MTETTPTQTDRTTTLRRPRRCPAREWSVHGAPPALRAEIDRAIAEIDLDDSNSILFFGSSAQAEVTSVADEMLDGVRNKDTGPAGRRSTKWCRRCAALRSTTSTRTRSAGSSRGSFGKAKPIAKVLQQYEQVRGQIDSISNRLDGHTSALMKDVGMLDRLYDKTLAYFHSLATYIAAGEECAAPSRRGTAAGAAERSRCQRRTC